MENLVTKVTEPFNSLQFTEKGHKYSVNGREIKKSVSALIEEFYEGFNAEVVAPYTARKLGKTTEEVLDEWADINLEAITRGTRVHLFGENYQVNRTLTPSCPQEIAVTKFWKDLPEHIIPVVAELRMYHFLKMFAGTADILLYDTKQNTYIIADYKTNKDLYKNFNGKVMLAPFSHLLDCPLNHYQLQLSYYQILLEQIGVKVSKRVIIWLKLDETYELISTEDLTAQLKILIN